MKTYEVMSSVGQRHVEAEKFTLSEAFLVFSAGDDIKALFAPGHWQYVREIDHT